jgi:Zn-dependent protease with chaperone function
MAQQRGYAFKTLKERALTLGSAIVGITALGVGLSAAFNPVALAVAGTYTACKVGSGLLMPIPAFRNWAFGHMVKKGHAELVSEDSDVYRLTKEISDSLGRPVPPKIYTVDTTVVAQIALPLGLRWVAKLKPIKDLLSEKAMPKVFAAIPGSNTLLTTKEALAAPISDAQLRFIAAHEMSHLKTDNLDPAMYGKAILKKITEPLMLAVGAALGASSFGFTLPVSALGLGVLGVLKAGAALVGIKYAAGAAINLGMRIVEKRADRNGLYITRDLKSAQETMDWLHEAKQKKPTSALKEATLDHPSYTKRMSALKTSFDAVAKYPPLQPTNDNPVPAFVPAQSSIRLAS